MPRRSGGVSNNLSHTTTARIVNFICVVVAPACTLDARGLARAAPSFSLGPLSRDCSSSAKVIAPRPPSATVIVFVTPGHSVRTCSVLKWLSACFISQVSFSFIGGPVPLFTGWVTWSPSFKNTATYTCCRPYLSCSIPSQLACESWQSFAFWARDCECCCSSCCASWCS